MLKSTVSTATQFSRWDLAQCWYGVLKSYTFLLNRVRWLLVNVSRVEERSNYCAVVDYIRMTWSVPAAVPQTMKLMKHTVIWSLSICQTLSAWIGKHLFFLSCSSWTIHMWYTGSVVDLRVCGRCGHNILGLDMFAIHNACFCWSLRYFSSKRVQTW